MKWFENHLNLTMLMVVAFTTFIIYLVSYLEEDAGLIITACIICAIAQLGTEIWYLRQKRRSLWFLLLNILNWIGLIILLNLENRRALSTYPKDKIVI